MGDRCEARTSRHSLSFEQFCFSTGYVLLLILFFRTITRCDSTSINKSISLSRASFLARSLFNLSICSGVSTVSGHLVYSRDQAPTVPWRGIFPPLRASIINCRWLLIAVNYRLPSIPLWTGCNGVDCRLSMVNSRLSIVDCRSGTVVRLLLVCDEIWNSCCHRLLFLFFTS